MVRIIAAILILQSIAIAEEIQFDGICRISSSNGKQWSGVAVSDSQIVSVWHPEEYGDIAIEFSEAHHGNTTRLRVSGKVTRVNRYADLSVITFKRPPYVKLRHYKIGNRNGDIVRIAGFVLDAPVVVDNATIVKVKFTDSNGAVSLQEEIVVSDGYRLDRFNVPGRAGMSGSPALENDIVVGIQTAGERRVLTVPSDTVQKFLNGEISDER